MAFWFIAGHKGRKKSAALLQLLEQDESGLSTMIGYLNNEGLNSGYVRGGAGRIGCAARAFEELIVEGFEGFIAGKEEGVFEVMGLPGQLRPLALGVVLPKKGRRFGQFFGYHLQDLSFLGGIALGDAAQVGEVELDGRWTLR
jgi:hypothetical protein